MSNGYCVYRYNPSEIYQRSKPGQGVETVCGAPTFPANDIPEIVNVPDEDGNLVWKHTGRFVTRVERDPHCPKHGGSSKPPEPPVSASDVAKAQARLQSIQSRYNAQRKAVTSAPHTEAVTDAEIVSDDTPEGA